MNESEIEFKQQWSACAGKASALEGAATEIERRAAAAFVKGKDELAKELRELATHFRCQLTVAKVELQEFIDKAATQPTLTPKGQEERI